MNGNWKLRSKRYHHLKWINNQDYLNRFLEMCELKSEYKVCDVGSGTGAMVNLARLMKVDAIGVDMIAEEPDVAHDLREPLNLGRTFALITCIEVAEHIPAENSGVFLNNVTSHVARGGRLIFSAAPPNQPGDGHVNLRQPYYWRSMIDERGLTYSDELTARLRLAWQWVPAPMMWLVGNVQVFER